MVELKPEPRKDVFLSVAITKEMKAELKLIATAKGFRGVSDLVRALAQKFLDGEFDEIEIVNSYRTTGVKESKLKKGKK